MTERPAPPRSTVATGNACVYVIGMHRSGTSAVTELLGRLGLATPPEHDLIPATKSNRHGHFESKQLVAFNERLLGHLGGAWTSPPDLPAGWETGGEATPLSEEAARLFAQVFPLRPAAWKDPRLCVLLPFWRRVVQPPAAAIFVCRAPAEVAVSLHTRDGLGALHARALWERYVRRASSAIEGLPTLVADYSRVLEDPTAWCGQLVDFLAASGIDARGLAAHDVEDVLDPAMRRQRLGGGDGDSFPGGADRVFDELRALHGPHASWSPPELGAEPGWVGDLLSMRAELDSLRRSLRRVERSRAYRLATWARGRQRSA